MRKRRCLPVATTSKAQSAFNGFIRERDEGKPCPSCGTYHPPMIFGGQWDCGHFMGVGARPELRFEEKMLTGSVKPVMVDRVGSLQRMPLYMPATGKR